MKIIACIAIVAIGVAASTQPLPQTLAGMRDHYRPLLVFTGGQVKLAEQQLSIASAHAAGFRDRQILIVGVEGSKSDVENVLLSPAEDAATRKRFHIRPGQFTVILLGKDGGEKLRSHQPIPYERLQTTIDAMPMRQSESRTP